MSNYIFLGFISIYISLIPSLGETQPIVLFIIGLIFFFDGLINKKNSYYALLFAILNFFLLYSVAFVFFADGDSGTLIKYLVFIFVTIAMCNLKSEYLSFNNYTIIAFFFIIIALDQKFFGNNLSFVFDVVTPRVNSSLEAGGRGVPIIAPEQSYMSLILASLIIMCNSTYIYSENKISKKTFIFTVVLLYILLILTGSLLSFLFLIGFLFIQFFKINHLPYLMIFLFVFILIVSENERVVDLVITITNIKDFTWKDFLVLMTIVEPSGSTRLILASLAVMYSMDNFIFGGLGAIKNNWFLVAHENGWDFIAYHSVLGLQYKSSMPTEPQTIFYSLISDLGWFMSLIIILFLIVFIFIKIKFDRLTLMVFYFLSFILFFQSSITSPYIGVCVSLLLTSCRYERR
ncbi:hypothetical protein CCZ37_12280 [Vibrio qinghaiensis]|uniref:Uncharacterized protein n=1 Tax=Vibrio qinghaiensis TaxID=2025808 RepID=A0A223N0U7_9VIBR|nr:hypothetical protein [Vibrio qinghaiensis]ASU23318.1 hypothetical protein CCZ37_12280 [Vibrio qinghaiensis]